MAELINRKQVKQEVRELLRSAWVSPKGMVALYMGITLGMELLLSLIGATGFVYTFIDILTTLIGSVLAVGFTLYCMAIRRGERAGYLTLFDGFTFVGKIVLLMIVETFSFWPGRCCSLFPASSLRTAIRLRFSISVKILISASWRPLR